MEYILTLTYFLLYILKHYIGVFDALTKEYLKSMSLKLYAKHPLTQEDIQLESYEFSLSYGR